MGDFNINLLDHDVVGKLFFIYVDWILIKHNTNFKEVELILAGEAS